MEYKLFEKYQSQQSKLPFLSFSFKGCARPFYSEGICSGGLYPGVYVLGGICPEGKCPGGKCPGGICPGVSVQGVHVRGGYVLEPEHTHTHSIVCV